MSNLQKGDVVSLKSGGPKMTIYDNGAYGSFICRWFNEKNELSRDVFEEHELEKVQPIKLKTLEDVSKKVSDSF